MHVCVSRECECALRNRCAFHERALEATDGKKEATVERENSEVKRVSRENGESLARSEN